MPMKADGSTTLAEIDRFDGGVGWIAYPDETMQRASHALQTDEDCGSSTPSTQTTLMSYSPSSATWLASSSVWTATSAIPPELPAGTTCRSTSHAG